MKVRLPQGAGKGTPNNLQQLARQAQKMQEDMDAANAELEAREYTATAGGNAVKVTMTGKLEITNLEISKDVVDPEDIEMISDLVTVAVNEVIRTATTEKEEILSKISGGLSVPGLF